ncbi:MAG TPA: tyrosine recombinase [Bacteroidia bacterium]|nr:tyrosine recombinase [Bacteroidia bacterium]HRS59024.1 tyrosine recombinase [Bacteroidia bacterium]HRU68096.1 tyrosine recombinase [Bacteroidia bacterium]
MIREFLHWLKYEKRFSEHTVNSYKSDLEQFEYFLKNIDKDLKLETATTPAIKSWIVNLMENGYHPSSAGRKLVALNTYFKYLIRENIREDNPASGVRTPKKPTRLVKYLEENEILKVLESCTYEESFEGLRDNLILELLYGTGIRLSELINLKMNDFDKSSGTIKVLGKRNKERIIPVNSTLRKKMEEYFLLRKSEISTDQPFLLLTAKGKKLYPMMVYRTVKKYVEQIVERTTISPHVLRHSFATHLLNRGADINAIKELLGHANLAATQIYTHHSIEKLKKVHKQSHPRG